MNGYTQRTHELIVAFSVNAELAERGSIGSKHLNAIVVSVTDIDISGGGINGYTLRIIELTIVRALTAEFSEVHSLLVKHLHSVVTTISNEHMSSDLIHTQF